MGQGRGGQQHLVECAAAQEVHVSRAKSDSPLSPSSPPTACSPHGCASLGLANATVSLLPPPRTSNFGIVKHPGSGSTNLTTAQQPELDGVGGGSDGAAEATKPAGLFGGRKDAGTAQTQLSSKGFIPVRWHGKCEADRVSMGTHDVLRGQGGMFGLVFDNTFSKQTSKTATFVLLTYPIGAPPQTAHHLPNLGGAVAAGARLARRPRARPRPSHSTACTATGHSQSAQRPVTARSGRSDGAGGGAGFVLLGGPSSANYHTGPLLKRRRKKGQGYARRYFSLDYATCTMSYYHNRNSSALRGAIPLSLAAIAADERRREYQHRLGRRGTGTSRPRATGNSVSGRGPWSGRAASRAAWWSLKEPSRDLLQLPRGWRPSRRRIPSRRRTGSGGRWRPWSAGSSARETPSGGLVKDMAVAKHAHPQSHRSPFLSPRTPSLSEEGDGLSAPQPEKRSFWRRKSSASPLVPGSLPSPVPSQLALPPPGGIPAAAAAANGSQSSRRRSLQEEHSMQDHCTSLLNDLDSVVAEFSNLLSASKRRRMPAPQPAVPRKSLESTTSTEEFFDAAEGGDPDGSQLLVIDNQSEGESPGLDGDDGCFHDSSSVSSVEDEEDFSSAGQSDLFPAKPKSLAPLPIAQAVRRRTSIPPSTVLPPSLIAFVRKNVGKDLSTISMPVSANEPTSLLQRLAEQLEYANLLDAAARQKSTTDRLLHVAAFAISQFSGGRAKERAIRKPFNPLLGETFELLRSDKETPGGFRLLVEKVTHRPVRLAMHADSAAWSFAQSPAPTQKFWGKSAELTTEGRVRVVLRLADGGEERYSWGVATVFLRNVVMGEKYVEPVGSMSVANDSTGARAVVEFRSKGMFGGRGEDVHVETYGADGSPGGVSMVGTWTTSLSIIPAGGKASSSGGREIWRAGPLVDNPAATYGMTAFAAGLNEMTPLEEGRLPPTDTRRRPDQRLAEEGRLDEAEGWKAKLEEAQRARRRQLEERGEEHRPKWFVKAATTQDGEEVWRFKGGKESYWEERARGNWGGIEDIFADS